MLENHAHEKYLLGCILLDNRLLDDYKITSRIFDKELHKEIFRQIEKLRASGAVANVVEVGMAMVKDAGYVASLTDVPSAANAKFYFDSLSDLALRRGLMNLARDVADMVNSERSTGDIMGEIDKGLIAVSDTRESGYQHIVDCMIGAVKEIESAYKMRGKLVGIDTGFEELNAKTNGWQKQAMIVVGARPGAGKTSLALHLATSALRDNRTVGIFSAEMSSASIIKRLISSWGHVEFSRIQSGFMGNQDMAKILEACQDLATQKLYINDQPSISLSSLVSDARKMRRKGSVDIIFIDYLSLVSNRKENTPRHEQVAEISMSLKGLARELDIPVIVLSQLTREAQGERPKLSQLRDSGAVEQDADMVILLHNLGYIDDSSRELGVKLNMIVEKNRNGAVGDIPIIFKPNLMRFTQNDANWA